MTDTEMVNGPRDYATGEPLSLPMQYSEMLIIANEVASRHGLIAEFLIGHDGKPARKVCVVGDDRKYNPSTGDTRRYLPRNIQSSRPYLHI